MLLCCCAVAGTTKSFDWQKTERILLCRETHFKIIKELRGYNYEIGRKIKQSAVDDVIEIPLNYAALQPDFTHQLLVPLV